MPFCAGGGWKMHDILAREKKTEAPLKINNSPHKLSFQIYN